MPAKRGDGLFFAKQNTQTKYFQRPAEMDDDFFVAAGLDDEEEILFGMPAEWGDGLFVCLLQNK